MKNYTPLLGYIGIFFLIISCSATNNLTMGITDPAIVSIRKGASRVGIINRSLPSEGNKQLDKLDRILSAEGMQLDEKGAEAAILSLTEALQRSNKFEEIKVLESDPDTRKGSGFFPAGLSWETIDRLCRENGVDLIFELAYYDTDTQVAFKIGTGQLPNEIGLKVSVPMHEVSLNTQIKNGWRIYDPQIREIVDEIEYLDQFVSVGKGINPLKAVEAVTRRNESVVQYSKDMGNAYGLRLSPTKHRVSRDYFVRGTDNFVIAKRRAQTGDWEGGAQLWAKEVHHPKSKIAGRACYNMAIINEINGNLDAAMEWASKSYTDHGNKDALRYLDLLRYRADQVNILREQASR
ncbi:MAG TPA: DUF6340 family protein [Arenibacter sp.]|nr:DUF6340 family protein [Arenibacter sp.]